MHLLTDGRKLFLAGQLRVIYFFLFLKKTIAIDCISGFVYVNNVWEYFLLVQYYISSFIVKCAYYVQYIYSHSSSY